MRKSFTAHRFMHDVSAYLDYLCLLHSFTLTHNF